MKVIETIGFRKLSHWDDNTQRGYESRPGRGGGGTEFFEDQTDNPSTDENELKFNPKFRKKRKRREKERMRQIQDPMPKGML